MKTLAKLWHSLICGCHREQHSSLWRGWLRLALPLMSVVALVWFLFRVIPKPIRASYPCQRAAFPFASACVMGLLAFTGRLAARLRLFRVTLRGAFLTAFAGAVAWGMAQAVYALVVIVSSSETQPVQTAPGWIPGDLPNSPVGPAKGIFPGRVTWIRDTNATPWRGPGNGYWWHSTNLNQSALDRMVSRSLRGLAGETNDTAAWDRIFRHYNLTHSRGDVGYRTNESITIKINLNNCYSGYADADNNIDASPQAVLALLRQLVNHAGVPQNRIVVYDATPAGGRAIPNRIYNPGHAEFPNVRWVDGRGLNGREAPNWVTGAISYTSASTACGTRLPKCVVDATYLINFALLKGHEISGITLCAKNHFGSIESPGSDHGKYVKPSAQAMGSYSAFVDFIGSPNLGGKTILSILDGLYGTRSNVGNVEDKDRWSNLFNGEWSASYFMSLDPVALDSVGLDFLRSEFGSTLGYSGSASFPMGAITNCDNYLHDAARGTNAVLGAYRPNGVVMGGAGVHEHWNNATEKKYSRNLNPTAKGIELLALHEAIQVTLASPLPNASFRAGSNLTLQAVFNVSDDRIARVDFLRNGALIGSALGFPWTVDWTNAAAGSCSIVAVATDMEGDRYASAPVPITIWQTDLQVAITSPLSGSSAAAGQNIFIVASASSTNTSVTSVTFLRDGSSLGTVAAAPYHLTWSNAPSGMHALTAVATGADGLSVTSAVVNLRVRPAGFVTAGALYVDLRPTDFVNGATVWTNRGSLGNFTKYNNPALVGDVAGTGVPGVQFNGSSDAFIGPNAVADIDGAGSRSFEAWVFNPAVGVEETMLNIGHRGTDARNCAFNFGSNLAYGACAQWGAWDVGWNTSGNVPSAGAWHHIVYTYNGATTCLIYVDGALRVTKNLSSVLNTFAGEPILLGAQRGTVASSAPSLFWFSGYLNSIRVHGGVLSASDVAANYAFGPDVASGAVAITSQPANTIALSGGMARFTASAGGAAPIQYQWLCNGAPLPAATNSTLTIGNISYSDHGAVFQLVASNVFNLTSCAATSAPATLSVLSVRSALIHRYSFTSNANDSIGSAHGTLNGAATLSSDRVNLNGTSGTYVNLPGGLIAGYPAVTLETWCSLGANANWVRLFDMGSTNGNNGQHDLYFCPRSGAGDYRLTVMDPQPSERIVNFAGNLDNRTNLHVACVLDTVSGFMGVYLNGELINARWDLKSLSSVATNLFFLGRSLFAADGWLHGSIDEFRVYGAALGRAQISENFSNGPDVAPPIEQDQIPSLDPQWIPESRVLQVSWPDNGIEWELLETTNLAPLANWRQAANIPALSNGVRFVVIQPGEEPARFFRLQGR